MFHYSRVMKAIIQSGIKRIVYESDKYAHTEGTIASKKMLESAGVELVQLPYRMELSIEKKEQL